MIRYNTSMDALNDMFTKIDSFILYITEANFALIIRVQHQFIYHQILVVKKIHLQNNTKTEGSVWKYSKG